MLKECGVNRELFCLFCNFSTLHWAFAAAMFRENDWWVASIVFNVEDYSEPKCHLVGQFIPQTHFFPFSN